MLDGDLRKLLIAQIGNELAAHSLYLAIAIYFERQSLDGWGKLFRHQSVEEAQHAQRIIDFLVDNDVEFDLPALKATSTRFGSPAEAARRAL
ncbi:MAG: ferritin-like domain-containing protein, partial [Chloroflexota bacterium]